jgi:membrane protein YdbS with pleckstrin-like domain
VEAVISLLQPLTRELDPFTQKRLQRLTALVMFLALLAFGLTIVWFFSKNAPRWVRFGAVIVDALALEASGRVYRLRHADKQEER